MSQRIRTRSPSLYAEKYPALARRRPVPTPPARSRDFSLVTIGTDQHGQTVVLEEQPRMEHALLVGSTGCGKTHLTAELALQDFRRGRGGMVFDPHGSQPDSLHHRLITDLHRDGFTAAERVHIIDPNIRSHVVPINFLARLDDTDISVLADSLLQAFERVWGDEDTLQKPTIRTILKATFMTLAEMNWPLTDARLLFDPHDSTGFRARTIAKLTNEYARDELERLHTMALDERNKRDFRATVVGPINRLAEFTSCDAIRAMCGVVDEPDKPRRTLDLLDGMNKGQIYLINLQHGPAVSEADTNLLGTMLLRYVFLLGSRRTNIEPFFLYIDEAARYLTGDVPSILAEMRKYGIAAQLNLQYMGQAGKPDDLMYQALLNSTEIKIVFRVKSPSEAQHLAELVVPLNLERAVAASVRPTVVGHRRTQLASRAISTQEATADGNAETIGEGYAVTASHSHSRSDGRSNTTTTGSGQFSAEGTSTGAVMAPSFQMFGPNAENATMLPYPLSESAGRSLSNGSSDNASTSVAASTVETETHGSAETYSQSRASTTSRSRSRGTSQSAGEHAAFESIYADLPSSFHSKDSELYRAGELIRALPVGRCFVSWRGKSVCISVPAPRKRS